MGRVCTQTPLSPEEVARFRTRFLQKPQSWYTHQFVTWANSAIRSSLLSCKIELDRGCTGTQGVQPLHVPPGPLPPSTGFPPHSALRG